MKKQRLEECLVYIVTYIVVGPNKVHITTKRNVCVIALDVADLVDQIKKICGTEIAGIDSNGINFFGVAEDVEIISAQLIGNLHGITDNAFKIVMACDKQERDNI